MRYVIMLVVALMLGGCAGSPQLPYQYATLKLIESERVSAEAVVDRTSQIRALLTESHGLTSWEITEGVHRIVGYGDLAPSDRLLVNALLTDALDSLPDDVSVEPSSHVVLGEDSYALLLERLEWIEQSAGMF